MEYRELKANVCDGADQFAVSSVTFDAVEELAWVANQGVSSSVSLSCLVPQLLLSHPPLWRIGFGAPRFLYELVVFLLAEQVYCFHLVVGVNSEVLR